MNLYFIRDIGQEQYGYGIFDNKEKYQYYFDKRKNEMGERKDKLILIKVIKFEFNKKFKDLDQVAVIDGEYRLIFPHNEDKDGTVRVIQLEPNKNFKWEDDDEKWMYITYQFELKDILN